MLIAIAAMTSDNLIGGNNQLLRHIPEDLKRFRDLTLGKTVVMGRKTYESIPEQFRPLPGRDNIVISTQKNYKLFTEKKNTSVKVLHTIENIIKKDTNQENIFIIGGSEVYKLFLPYCQKLYISEVKGSYKGDAYFPEFTDQFQEISRESHNTYDFVIYNRKN